jgi:hypothetical protein
MPYISEAFTYTERDGQVLIVPKHSTVTSNAAWDKDTVWYRSRIEQDGVLVSQGFHKFFNLGCGPEALQITVQDIVRACERGDAVATFKMDGSLLIRSVCGGRVILRTRGSFEYSFMKNAHEVEEFKNTIPRLDDPSYYPNHSLLLEWVSPNNQIVIKYPQPSLILVGAVDHSFMSYLKLSQLSLIAEEMGIEVVSNFHLNTQGWEALNKTLESDGEQEGYVIRINGEQDLVKIKCLPYLTKHALKSNLTTEKLVDWYLEMDSPSYQEFTQDFTNRFDEETCMWAMPAISSLFDGIDSFQKTLAHMKKNVGIRKNLSRKDYAIAFKSEYGSTKKFAAAMRLYEDREIDKSILKSLILQHTKQVELSMFNE